MLGNVPGRGYTETDRNSRSREPVRHRRRSVFTQCEIPVWYFYFTTTPTSLYSLAIRRNYTGTCHEESHLGSRRLCGLP
ncbi:hypothetical protein ALC57_02516 [Trachymyrmex cornetzi]|uniref:Uncharacterized protein n=1 Tax=Trachymyrmex cornetzi TaxID=471704 RepID=A0A195EIJ8_9HYME|nr:hypothetical protein ALC57_02516 [Trachymyrmex cornetzi]